MNIREVFAEHGIDFLDSLQMEAIERNQDSLEVSLLFEALPLLSADETVSIDTCVSLTLLLDAIIHDRVTPLQDLTSLQLLLYEERLLPNELILWSIIFEESDPKKLTALVAEYTPALNEFVNRYLGIGSSGLQGYDLAISILEKVSPYQLKTLFAQDESNNLLAKLVALHSKLYCDPVGFQPYTHFRNHAAWILSSNCTPESTFDDLYSTVATSDEATQTSIDLASLLSQPPRASEVDYQERLEMLLDWGITRLNEIIDDEELSLNGSDMLSTVTDGALELLSGGGKFTDSLKFQFFRPIEETNKGGVNRWYMSDVVLMIIFFHYENTRWGGGGTRSKDRQRLIDSLRATMEKRLNR